MTNRRTAAGFAGLAALTAWLSASGFVQANAQPAGSGGQSRTPEFSGAAKAALSRQLRSSVSLGDSPGVVARGQFELGWCLQH